MTDMTLREQMYRRWKKGEDYCVLAKEMGVTREWMRIMLKRMDAEVPLVDRIEELEVKLAHAVDGLKECEAEIDAYIQYEYPHDHPIQERCRQRDYAANPARITLSDLTGAKKDGD